MNEFTGMSTGKLKRKLSELKHHEAAMQRALEDGEELGGGSPFERLYDEMSATETELARRENEVYRSSGGDNG